LRQVAEGKHTPREEEEVPTPCLGKRSEAQVTDEDKLEEMKRKIQKLEQELE